MVQAGLTVQPYSLLDPAEHREMGPWHNTSLTREKHLTPLFK